mmetsp:Transcript_38293/g.97904  ORF Transcript_38293/g.97904 Transcript_38293/m.97904 type:complete len:580 (-) Transcript_38293:422-2161(-)|eukprot:jgi/Tetstr1/462110/TSEL_007178.t1
MAAAQRHGGLAANGDPIKTGAWTEDEDALLAEMQAKVGNRWSTVALHIPGRTGQQCAQRWRHKVNPNIRKEKWSEEEDRVLEALVAEIGPRWADIARRCPGRTDQQCMGRWRRHLDPSIKRDAWSAQEDKALLRLHKLHGRQWSLISKQMAARTAQQCRARFFQMQPSAEPSATPEATPPKASAAAAAKKNAGKPPKAAPSRHAAPPSKPHPALSSSTPPRPMSSSEQSCQTAPHQHGRACQPVAVKAEAAQDASPDATSVPAKARAYAKGARGSAASSIKKEDGSEREPPRTPPPPQRASSATPAGSMPLLAALSPQQLSATLLASASPLMSHWSSPGWSARMMSPPLMQDSPPWRFSPAARSPLPRLSPFGPSFFLPADSKASPGAPPLPTPQASSPAELPPWSRELARRGQAAEEAGRGGAALFAGVKRKLSLAPVEERPDEAAEDGEEEQEEVSPGWKKLKAESGKEQRRESMILGTPVQLQASLGHSGRPSLTPLPLPTAPRGTAVLPFSSPATRLAAEETATPTKKAAAAAMSPTGLAQPKRQLTRRRGPANGVAAARSRLNALLKAEDTAVA